MKAKIRGTEIYFDIAGMQFPSLNNDFVENPVLFLLHGGPGGNHFRYKQHSIELAKFAQLVFIDHRGCGFSKKTKQKEYTLKNNIDDIEALRKYLGLNKISILGTSYGGIVALGYAIKYPKHLEKLILVATSPSHAFLEESKKIVAQKGSPSQKEAARKLFEGKLQSKTQIRHFFQIMNSLYSIKSKKRKKDLNSKIATLWNPEALNQGFTGFLRHYDFRPKLNKIKCPSLILSGEDDWICPPRQAKALKKGIPNSELIIFKNCSHAVAIDQHQAYIRNIQHFLKNKQ